jgi:hypothetical protein
MENKTFITKKEIQEQISNFKETDINELGIGSKIKNVISGIKGFTKGEGFNYFRFLKYLNISTNKIKRHFPSQEKAVYDLYKLKSKVSSSKVDASKKAWLEYNLDEIIKRYDKLQKLVDKVENESFKLLNS